MKLRRTLTLVALSLCCLLIAPAVADSKGTINFPDIPGYKTLKCDLHVHTVFSDGQVWPTVRVDEAFRLGLDAISITDHIEYQPHKNDIPTNHNRPYEIAVQSAKEKNILLIKGTEITRSTPPGHFNAVFLRDVNPVDTKDLLEATKAAKDQGAFIFWNHPDWKPDKKGWFDIHTQLYDAGCINGIEVCNGDGYHLSGHKWAIEKNLTMMGNSDIHSPDISSAHTPEKHRTITLVFAREKTIDSIKDALINRRTVVWYQNQLIGPQEYLEQLLEQSVSIAAPHYRRGDYVWIEITNKCELDLAVKKIGGQGPASLVLPANAATIVRVKVDKEQTWLDLSYEVTNCLTAPGKGLPVEVGVPLQ